MKDKKLHEQFDVFISYRRETGADDARLLQQALKARGYNVFFDYDSLRDGKFDQKIFDAIDEARVFILMLTKGALDKCINEDDWVRQEIERAIEKQRVIVPVQPSNQSFTYPDHLPDSIKTIRNIQNSELNKASLFEESVDKIIDDRFPNREPTKREPTKCKAGMVRTITLPGEAKMEMIYCSPGEFMMGSPVGEEGRIGNETPHRVTLTRGFWLGKYPVTQRQWTGVMGNNPSICKGDDDLPVENVSWNDCMEFVRKVNAQLNCGARLPTEAEWEYACRAGKTWRYGGTGNIDDMGWYSGNSRIGEAQVTKFLGIPVKVEERRQTHPVGLKEPNDWGFCDMHGNVWEWCNDWCDNYSSDNTRDPSGPSSGNSRVLRGGSYLDDAKHCRCARHHGNSPSNRSQNIGFRLCCSAAIRE